MSKLILDVTTWLDATGNAHAAVLAQQGTPDRTMQQSAQRAIKRRLVASGDATPGYKVKTEEYPLDTSAQTRQYAEDFGASIHFGAVARAYREKV